MESSVTVRRYRFLMQSTLWIWQSKDGNGMRRKVLTIKLLRTAEL
jgi:hypothetical protein